MDLSTILSNINLCDKMDESELGKIGQRVIRDYDSDMESMKDWKDRNETAFEIIEHSFTKKSEPWDNAANTKIPLVMNAAIKFQAEAGAEIIKGHEIVKTEIFGEKTDEKAERAERVKAHMNYQLFNEMDNWEGDMDQLMMVLPIVGCVHKKVYYNPATKRNEAELCLDNVVISQEARGIKNTRVSMVVSKDKNTIYENETSGYWRKIEYAEDPDGDGIEEYIEQHRRLDLDEDGYEEPYIVVVHKETQKCVRVTANFRQESIERAEEKILRIEPVYSFVKYEFIPAPDGSYWSYGWGIFLGPLNDNVNTIVNQLLDAGTLSNTGGGWHSLKIRGDQRHKPGEWKQVRTTGGTIKDSIFPLPVKEPSQTLFILLELLIQQAKDFTSITDVIAGDQPQANMAEGTILALIEQGKKTFNSIYKRIYRSLKSEFHKLYDLNAIYTDPQFYEEFFDIKANPLEDYASSGYDIIPTANPEFSSKIQRIAQAQTLMTIRGQGGNDQEILRRFVLALEIDNPDVIVPEQPMMTPEQIAEAMEQKKLEIINSLEVREKEAMAAKAEIELRIKEVEAEEKGLVLPLKVALAEQKVELEEVKIENEEIKGEQRGLSEVANAT